MDYFSHSSDLTLEQRAVDWPNGRTFLGKKRRLLWTFHTIEKDGSSNYTSIRKRGSFDEEVRCRRVRRVPIVTERGMGICRMDLDLSPASITRLLAGSKSLLTYQSAKVTTLTCFGFRLIFRTFRVRARWSPRSHNRSLVGRYTYNGRTHIASRKETSKLCRPSIACRAESGS